MSKKSQHKVMGIMYIILLVLVGLVLISPFLIPIIFAASVALAIFPLQLKLESMGMLRKRAAALLTVLFTLIVSIPFFFFLIQGTLTITAQLEKFHDTKEFQSHGVQNMVKSLKIELVEKIHQHASMYESAQFLTPKKIDSYLSTVTSYLLKFFQDFATNLPLVFLFFLIMVLCTYSFLKNADSLKSFFQKLFGFNDTRMTELANIFINDSRQVYVSNIATGGIQSLIIATTVSLTGVGDFFLVFFITLILSFIPVIGAAPVGFVAALLAYFQGNNSTAILLVVVSSFSGVVDNFLRPYLSTLGESRIPAISSFICVLGGAIILGFPGLFIGMLVGAIAYDTLPLFWNEVKTESFFDK